ncbi:MAG: acyltransferase domain-containing protein, partial [Pseudomonadota bacterium]
MTEQTAFLFPGQGSQSVGMMAALSEERPEVLETFAEASEALGFDLWRLCQAGDAEDLNRTENTQPAMLAADVATWRVWRAIGG